MGNQYDLDELLSSRSFAKSSSDLDKFTDMLNNLLDKVWGSNWGVFTEEEPTGNESESAPMPHITYHLESRMPLKNKGIKKTLFETFSDPEHSGYNIKLYRRWFECVVEFHIFARTNREARVVAEKFDNFMDTYSGYFKEQGVSEIVFLKESPPEIGTQNRISIPHRILSYKVHIERIQAERTFTLKDVKEVINPKPGNLLVEENDNNLIDGTMDLNNSPDKFMDLYKEHIEDYPRKPKEDK